MLSVMDAMDFAANIHLFRDSSASRDEGRWSRIVAACATICDRATVSPSNGRELKPPLSGRVVLNRSIR